MSCEIKQLAKIIDLKRVQELFGFTHDEDWLNAVFLSLSPTLELIAFGHGTKLIILSPIWNSDQQQNLYSISYNGHLENPNDIITSVLCLPVIGQSGHHTQSTAEWTCIAIGLSSGLVLFYTDSGIQIFSQQWHNEPIKSIKAQSGRKITEEIHLSYQSCICIIQGIHLFQVLKTIKNNLVKGSSDLSPSSDIVPCRKWGFAGKYVAITDSVVVGPQMSSGFDHLLTASLEGGFNAKYRNSPPQNSLVIGVGSKPFVGFHYAKEGFIQPVLADVARAVASKIKSALPNWLTGAQQVPESETPPPIPSEPMICRFGLCDHQRNAMNIWLAPRNQLAAVSDSLGRIILVDCGKNIALRVWKGYREAQCSFIEVAERNTNTKSNQKQDRRHAIFLVIFAPRRSCLEIWPLQRGPKTAAFNASKYGQLLYNSYGLMGVTPGGGKIKYNNSSCLFFDPTTSSLKEIVVPFHCALTDSNSKTAKDLHLLKRMKLCIRCDTGTEEQVITEVTTICCNFQTNEIRLLCIEMLIKNKIKPNILKASLNSIQDQLLLDEAEDDEKINELNESKTNDNTDELLDKSDTEITQQMHREHLLLICKNYLKLIDFYLYITELEDIEEEINSDDENTFNKNDEKTEMNSYNSEQMNISAMELNNIQRLLDLVSNEDPKNDTPKVTFKEKEINKTMFIDYLTAFNVQHDDEISLKDVKFNLIGSIIYQKFLENGKSFKKFLKEFYKSGILSEDFLKLLLFYWLNKPFLYTKSEELILDMTRFSMILQNICLLAGNKVEFEYNSISCWWQNAREILLESSCALRGLLASIMCRNQALKCSQKDMTEEGILSAEEDNLFEQVSQEACQWNLLIGKLDDIAVLGAVLSVPLKSSNPTMPVLKYEKPDISLKSILNGGKGIVSELVAKWIGSTGISPDKLLETINSTTNNDNEKTESNIKKNVYQKYPLNSNDLLTKTNDDKNITTKIETKLTENENDADKNLDPVLYNLNMLREHFPFSLHSGILLSHLTWEYMSYWSKNLSSLNYLESGLQILNTIKTENYALKHGLCSMIWNAHLKIPLEATKKIINKVGRLPKEKLCLQDIGLSDSLVPQLLEYCSIFLEQFLSSIDHIKMDLCYEETLQEGPIPLALLTLQQNLANADLLKLHMELNFVLHLISFFNIKSIKPKNLFNGLTNQSFFCEINRKLLYNIPKSDLILDNIRTEFLCKTITNSMDLIREDLEHLFLNEHILWMEKIYNLAKIWEIDLIVLKKHQIVELYAHGWDSYGEDLLDELVDTQNIGSLLLKIAGRRLNMYTSVNRNSWSHVAAVGPLLTDYLDTLTKSDNESNGLQDSKDISIDKLCDLTGKIFQCLSKMDSKELRIAGLLFDACQTIKEST